MIYPEELLCAFDTVRFFVVSGNVFDPILYYSHAMSFVPALILGLWVLFANRKSLQNQLFSAFSLLFSLYVFFDLMLWASDQRGQVMFIWSALVLISPLIVALCYYFIYVFIKKKDLPFSHKLIFGALFLPIVFLAHTDFNLTGYDLTNCDREAIEGPLWAYVYYLQYALTALIITFFVFNYRKVEQKTRKGAFLVGIGITFFLFTFIGGNVLGSITGDWRYEPYGFFGMPVFLGLLAYGMARGTLLNIKIIGANILVVILWGLVAGLLLINNLAFLHKVVWITLALAVVLGVFLIRSVKREVKTREKIEKLAEDLEDINKHLEERVAEQTAEIRASYEVEKKARVELARLNTTKNQFIMITQHHLRTPITNINWQVEAMQKGAYGEVSEVFKEALQGTSESVHRLSHIIDDFLKITEIEVGKKILTVSPTDIKALIEGVVGEFKDAIATKNISVTYVGARVNGSQAWPTISVDRENMKEALFIIVENAVRYNIKNGSITVVHKVEEDQFKLIIENTGIGIRPEDKERIFKELFSRGAEANVAYTTGMGIGLPIAKAIIEAHNGTISVDSEGEGKGAKVCVSLPL